MKVYVADGYANLRTLLVQMLAHDGHDVAAAHDGSSLLAMTIEAVPDVIVAELALGAMSALDVLIQLRKAGMHVPAILMTSASPDDIEATASRLGVRCVLQKPFKIEALEDALALVSNPR